MVKAITANSKINFNVVNLILYAGIGVGAYYLIKKIRQDNENKRKGKERDDMLIKEIDKKTKLSYSRSTYKDLAAKIYQATRIQENTDENMLYSALRQFKNKNDFIQTQRDFGKRKYCTAWVPFCLDYEYLTMTEAIRQVLDSDELQKAKAILNKINVII